ncbi:PAS domain S-box protein [Paenibacillus lemnae]|uniref:histidine kinase n=2 Tax=Paenibacillus lemnae TaxID=1330551 RepID=A0A848MAW5_PAELE|nr:PAS domain S-box protein [Paenibacillus lemnae]
MIDDEGLWKKMMLQALESSPMGMACLSPDGRIQNVNPSACLMLGYEAEELIHHYYEEWVHPDDAILNPLYRSEWAKDEPYTYETEVRLIHKLGHIVWVSFTLQSVTEKDGAPVGYIVYLQDLTEQKRASDYAESMMIQSDKLSIAGQLAAGIAHEIRNPMTSIKGFVQLLRTGYGSKQQYFDIISSEIERIELILGELLILAKPQSIKYESKDIRLLLEQVITLLNTQAILNNVEIQTDFDLNAPYVQCDENQMKQVFINFIKNAVESMASGGTITIRMDGGSPGELHIYFTDEGCGMPDSILSRLGEPFYTTKEKGTGLGFMISKKMIEEHQGSVHVNSKPGEGTTIKVTLPAVSDARTTSS